MGDGRAEGSLAIGDEGQAPVDGRGSELEIKILSDWTLYSAVQ